MSAVAGRVLIIPKGAYVAGTTYNMLDLVKYNSKSFLAKRTNTNVTPVDGADWMELTDDGVQSFNGRSGAVSPASGDYDITDMGDVNITSPTDGQGLRYNAQSGKWENGDAASAVSNLTDVDLTNLANGQILKYNSTAQKWENVDEKGHTIQNASGTAQTQRANMQFADSHVSDDSTNGRTVVENVKEVASADYSSETEDGMYLILDGEGAVIEPASDDYVQVVADGVKTYAQLLYEIYTDAKFDATKLNENSYIVITSSYYNYSNTFRFEQISGGKYRFVLPILVEGQSSAETISLVLGSTCSYVSYDTTYHDNSSIKPDSSHTITLYYGNKKATVDLQTTANRCWYDSSNTVKQKIDGLDVGKVNQVYTDWDFSLSFKARGGNGHAFLMAWQCVMLIVYNDNGVISITDIFGSDASNFTSSISGGIITITRNSATAMTLFY